MEEETNRLNKADLEKLDASCCRREPKCGRDPHTCDYYGASRLKKGEVRLGGIYEPRSPDELETGLTNPCNEEEEEGECDGEEQDQEQRTEERQRQCELAMRKWSMDFLHPLATCCQDQTQVAKKKLQDMEQVQLATERIMEKFSGLTLGFTGPLPDENVIQYHGLKVDRNKEMCCNTCKKPDYPDDLHMKRVRKPMKGQQARLFNRRNRRCWETECKMDLGSISAAFTPSFHSMRSSGRGKRLSKGINVSAKGQGQDRGQGDDTYSLSTEGAEEEQSMAETEEEEKVDQYGEAIPPSTDDLILEYVEKHNLEMMFEYFLALCCLHTPDNPYQFISDLANQMMEARNDEETFNCLERIFKPEHVAAIFRIFDKEQNGFVSLKQYKTAMEILGLVHYNMEPVGHDLDQINEETFVTAGVKALDELLKSYLYAEPERF